MKPYQNIPILDCGEPLSPIPIDQFAIEDPHPYVKLGANYGGKSPYYLRQGVVERLKQAQQILQQEVPGWRIRVFDAYRPIAVQHYMVDYSFNQVVQEQGLTVEQLTDAQRQSIWAQVYQFWAVPSLDPATPPPHSTGAAVDVTLVDAHGTEVDMGSAIDEMTPRSYPDYFAAQANQPFHANRQQLCRAMLGAGFLQHPHEWWHFSFGDQLWVWLMNRDNHAIPTARYGSI